MGRKLERADISPVYTIAMAYDSSNNLEYLGKAVSGASSSDASWQIKRFTYDSDNNLTDIQLADGNDDFDNVYDDRASLSYS